MVGVAVNVIKVPEQTVVAVAAMETVGDAELLTVIAIAFDVPFVEVAHGLTIEMIHVTTSPLFNDEVANDVLFVPTFVPLTFH